MQLCPMSFVTTSRNAALIGQNHLLSHLVSLLISAKVSQDILPRVCLSDCNLLTEMFQEQEGSGWYVSPNNANSVKFIGPDRVTNDFL